MLAWRTLIIDHILSYFPGYGIVAGFLGLVAADMIIFSNFKPLCMPAFLIARHHAARREKAFADCSSPFLGFSKCTAELIRHPRVLRPVVPTVRFVMRHPVLCNRFNRFIFYISWTLLKARLFPLDLPRREGLSAAEEDPRVRVQSVLRRGDD